MITLSSSAERRQIELDYNALWDRLNLSQKFSASSLSQFGYDLAFIRRVNNKNIAFMLLNNKVAAIDENGEIDSKPDIAIRK